MSKLIIHFEVLILKISLYNIIAQKITTILETFNKYETMCY